VQTLVVNIQPGRLASFSDAAIADLLAVEVPPGLIVNSGMDEGMSAGIEPALYFHVTFQTGKINALWPLVRERLHKLALENATIVVCTGEREWDDYLLLHHYDPAEALA
jgi:hypothetical protein